MRLLIFFGLFILLYYLVKGWISPSRSSRIERTEGEWELDGEMVKDPCCETYIPRDSAIRARIDGRDYYFCSKECLRKFKGQME
jgi:uncharacterized protein